MPRFTKTLLAGCLATLSLGIGALTILPERVYADGPRRSDQSAPSKTKGKVPTKRPGPEIIYCRGPFAVSVDNSGLIVQAEGRLSKKGAGPKGVNLQPGECGWSDRAWSSDWAMIELSEVHVGQVDAIVSACAHDSECIMRSTRSKQSARPGWASTTGDGSRIVTSPRPFRYKSAL